MEMADLAFPRKPEAAADHTARLEAEDTPATINPANSPSVEPLPSTAVGPKPSYYRRELPAPAVAFSSAEGRLLFRQALADGSMEAFFPLAEQLHTQAEPAYCGLATLVVVLNTLAIDPGVEWKGPWRWYDERALECCKPLWLVARDGIDFEDWLCLATCQGVHALGVRADEAAGASVDAFRAVLVAHARSSGVERALVVSYARGVLGQTGDGHFSPIGGYHAALDLALILDTARFKYPPHWVPVAQLWAAMCARDASTGQARGYALISAVPATAGAWLRLGLSGRHFTRLAAELAARLPAELARCAARAAAADGAREARAGAELGAFARALPAEAACLVGLGAAPTLEGGSTLAVAAEAAAAPALMALRRTQLYAAIAREEAAGGDGREAADGASAAAPRAQRAAMQQAILCVVIGRSSDALASLSREAAALWQAPLPLVEGAELTTDEERLTVEAGLRSLEAELARACEQARSVIACVGSSGRGYCNVESAAGREGEARTAAEGCAIKRPRR
jgi:hypothetical protein